MKITVIGCGRWGSLIAWYLAKTGHEVTLYGKDSSPHMKALLDTRSNGLITLPDNIALSTEISSAKDAEVIIISINSQGLRALMHELSPLGLENKIFVLCMKGIEIGSGKRLSTVARECTSPTNRITVWLGPGHPEEFSAGIPNCMVIDGEDEETKSLLIKEFSGPLIRFYCGEDLIGNEIGAAVKNVIGIAAGMLDGLGISSLKGALMSRGTREVSRLISALGGNELSAYGLCHLGDYEATVFSSHSHNRKFGESLILGMEYNELAEGYYTADAVHRLALAHGVDMPICRAVYEVLYDKKPPHEALAELFERSLKREFYK